MKPLRRKTIVLAISALPCVAFANPEGGQVVAGSATIHQESATKLGITQTSDKAIIDWRSYSIGANEHVQYYQPSVASVILNRVTGQDPSQILGRLTANGQVFLVNPNGIYFGRNAQIDVAGLVASTHNIRNEDFMAGKYNFKIPGKPGASVINEGKIRIADTGIAAFVAPSVANRGVIAARLGKVELAAANGFTLDFTGDNLLSFMVNDEVAQTAYDIEGNRLTSFVENSGKIEAQGGFVLLTARAAENAIHSVINHSGVIEATSVGEQNGEIVLSGGAKGVVATSGTLDASGKGPGETGGRIEVTGEEIELLNGTKIDVSGQKGGGTVIVGGDYLGGKATAAQQAENGITLEAHSIPTANNVRVEAGASIDASGTVYGDGGKVIVWADNRLDFDGSISSRGGRDGGDGGRVETSGKQQLFVRGTVDAGAGKGQGGLWFMDPLDVVIGIVGNPGVTHAASAIASSLNEGTTVTIQSDSGARPGSITVLDSIIKTAGGTSTLNLYTDGAVIINRGGRIVSTSGALNVNINARYNIANPGYGLVAIGNDTDYAIQTNGGNVDIMGLIQTYQGKAIQTNGGQVLARTTPTPGNPDSRGFIGIGPTPINAPDAYTIDAGTGKVSMRATGGQITLDNHAIRSGHTDGVFLTAKSVSSQPNILAVNLANEASRSVIENGFGGASGYGTNFPRNDDNSIPVDISTLAGTGLTLLGRNFGKTIYLSNNGYMRFDTQDDIFTPYPLSSTNNPIVAAYFGDVDTRGTGNVYYATNRTSSSNKAVLTWIGTGYFNMRTNKTNTFQLQLDNLGTETEIRLSWSQLQWTTGDASGGSNGLGGTVARAGIAIPGTNQTVRFELPSSGRQTDMLALASLPGNTGKVGVWSFRLWPEATPPNRNDGRVEVLAKSLTVMNDNGTPITDHGLTQGSYVDEASLRESVEQRRTENYLSRLYGEFKDEIKAIKAIPQSIGIRYFLKAQSIILKNLNKGRSFKQALVTLKNSMGSAITKDAIIKKGISAKTNFITIGGYILDKTGINEGRIKITAPEGSSWYEEIPYDLIDSLNAFFGLAEVTSE
jgi:filamentous hemagglutinin family protein